MKKKDSRALYRKLVGLLEWDKKNEEDRKAIENSVYWQKLSQSERERITYIFATERRDANEVLANVLRENQDNVLYLISAHKHSSGGSKGRSGGDTHKNYYHHNHSTSRKKT